MRPGRLSLPWFLAVAAVTLALACAPAPPPPTPTPPPPKPAVPAAQPTVGVQPTAAPTPAPAATAASKPAAPAKPGLDKVTFRFGFFPRGEDAPFWLALERGYYGQNNLDVTLGPGRGGLVNTQIVANKSETFTYNAPSTFAQGVAEGLPIKGVALLVGQSPIAVIAHPDRGIRTPKDLEGKTLMHATGDTPSGLFPAFAKTVGLDLAKVRMTAVESRTKNYLFLEGRADATLIYVSNELPTIEKESGKKFTVLKFSDYGVSALGAGIITHLDTIRQQPDLVRRFVTATLRGYDEMVKDPRAAVDAFMKNNAEADREITLRQIEVTNSLLRTKRTQGKPLGWSDEDDWKELVDMLVSLGQLKTRPALADLYTNEFLPKP